MRVVSLIALLVVATPALAQQAPTQTAEQPKEEKQICRRIPVTGSNFSKRECHTKAEWQQINAANQASASRALDNRRMGSNSGM